MDYDRILEVNFHDPNARLTPMEQVFGEGITENDYFLATAQRTMLPGHRGRVAHTMTNGRNTLGFIGLFRKSKGDVVIRSVTGSGFLVVYNSYESWSFKRNRSQGSGGRNALPQMAGTKPHLSSVVPVFYADDILDHYGVTNPLARAWFRGDNDSPVLGQSIDIRKGYEVPCYRADPNFSVLARDAMLPRGTRLEMEFIGAGGPTTIYGSTAGRDVATSIQSFTLLDDVTWQSGGFSLTGAPETTFPNPVSSSADAPSDPQRLTRLPWTVPETYQAEIAPEGVSTNIHDVSNPQLIHVSNNWRGLPAPIETWAGPQNGATIPFSNFVDPGSSALFSSPDLGIFQDRSAVYKSIWANFELTFVIGRQISGPGTNFKFGWLQQDTLQEITIKSVPTGGRAKMWARQTSRTGALTGRSDTAIENATFTMRYDNRMTPFSSIVEPDGTVWTVASITELGRRSAMQVHCQREEAL